MPANLPLQLVSLRGQCAEGGTEDQDTEEKVNTTVRATGTLDKRFRMPEVENTLHQGLCYIAARTVQLKPYTYPQGTPHVLAPHVHSSVSLLAWFRGFGPLLDCFCEVFR